MVMFDHNIVPPARQQTNASSFLMTLMIDIRAKSASLFRFLYDDNDVLELAAADDDDDGMRNDLWEIEDVAPLVADLPLVHIIPLPPPKKPKKKRTKFPQMNQRESIWWTRFLAPAQRAELLLHPNGRLAKYFRKLFSIWF
jgi:hypothetical protein